MSKFDKDYIALCEKILGEGYKRHNRTGVDTYMIPSAHLEFDLGKEFPILTTKQVFVRKAILEMMWIWQVQSNDVRWLQERNVDIWNEWEVDEDGIYRIYDNKSTTSDPNKEVQVMDLDGKPMIGEDGKPMMTKGRLQDKTIKSAKFYGKEFAHTIGTAYGYIVKKYGLMDSLLDTIKNNPDDRRMVKSLWQDGELRTAVLPSCVWSTEWDVTDNKLNLMVHQRSCDVPLGLPFNVTQYATLARMVAQATNLKPGIIDYSIKNAHIYENQVQGIMEQIDRFKKKGDYPAPELWLNPDVKDFYQFDHSTEPQDVKLVRYRHMGPIKFPIAQ